MFLMMMKLAASALSAFSPSPLAAVGNFAQGGSTVDVDDGYLFRGCLRKGWDGTAHQYSRGKLNPVLMLLSLSIYITLVYHTIRDDDDDDSACRQGFDRTLRRVC